ncbi:MAG: hypothetical protein IPI37_05655 [Bacteroidales bacterium]|nr:hypothetical protein [Bacteroidales bacterium]
MNKGTIGLNNEKTRDQAVVRKSPRKLSLRDSGLMHLFDELDLEVRQGLIDYLDRKGLVKGSGMLVIPSSRHYFYDAEDMKGIRTVINLRQLNYIREIRDFLRQITGLLPAKSNFIGCFIDNRSHGAGSDKNAGSSGHASDKADAYENGIESRIPFINRMYSIIDLRTNRYLTRRTVANLLKESGLELVGMTEINGFTYFHARKSNPAA